MHIQGNMLRGGEIHGRACPAGYVEETSLTKSLLAADPHCLFSATVLEPHILHISALGVLQQSQSRSRYENRRRAGDGEGAGRV